VFNPAASLDVLDWVIDDNDLILIMSVNPAFKRPEFTDAALARSNTPANVSPRRAKTSPGVDGGIKVNNTPVWLPPPGRHFCRQRDLGQPGLPIGHGRNAQRWHAKGRLHALASYPGGQPNSIVQAVKRQIGR
jgi:hypothetical protein